MLPLCASRVGAIGGHGQADDQIHRQLIGSVEIQRLMQAQKSGADLFQAFQPGVGNGHAMPQAGTAHALATAQGLEQSAAILAFGALGEQFAQLFQNPFFTGGATIRGYPLHR